jgi:hypothetical protein
MEWIKIFKREKPKQTMPEPKFEDNWMAEKYQQNVKEGVLALQNGKSVKILDDGRGYELACDIKRQFILEYQKQLSEKIKIDGGSEITVSLIHEGLNL